MLLGACSEDEPNFPLEDDETFFDEVAYLQNNLAVPDGEGNIKERVFGRPLDESNPQAVSVGVDNFDEAREIFAVLFSPATKISDDGLSAHFTTVKGNAELKRINADNGIIARADFNVGGLKFVSSMNFVLNSAWPENDNSKGFHTLGVQYQYCGWKDNHKWIAKDDHMHTFVCIREYKNGIPALLVGISNQEYHKPSLLKEELYVTMKDVNTVHQILISNWSYFKAIFNNNDKNLLDENSYYWINKKGLLTMCYPVASLFGNKWKDGNNKFYRILFIKLGN